ncbi:hypothetical protein [Hydrogenophaga defluvii]|uniref:Uncharacterized protein n=1 Tax=Hydrogenophaga defluvii TaxID=249410 RepID=A0ABW2SHV0_9BURK
MTKKLAAVLAWHYTTGEKFRYIVVSGELIPTAFAAPENERPVLWFSLNQSFEPTAAKWLIDPVTGIKRGATMAEMMELGGGLVRFGVSPRRLLMGEQLRTRAGIKRTEWASLCRSAFVMGADPAHWLGTLDPVEVETCVVEVMDKAGAWVRVSSTASH